ncbi:hypothetical protein Tsubulata_041704 [Turnera subulata]|uniref:Protein kinase domain-containing protein n=1 Tax=Turnera subulata TaxID=218843 RepID=A0A9Q0F942_9ROSI|nr:hypothetical protein Tsubulata_041704 [Turnera subulata]
MMETGRLLFAGCIAFLSLEVLFPTCNARDTRVCATLCGHLHNISYPFRLANDPQRCGEHNYTLHCEKNVPVLYLYSGRYYVQEINYHNFTIRLVDDGVQKGNCSSRPRTSLTYGNFSIGDPYTWNYYKIRPDAYFFGYLFCMQYNPESECLPKLSEAVVFITCPNPVNSPLYVDTAPCRTEGRYHLKTRSYINVGGMNSSDLMESCRVDMMMLLPDKDCKNMSFKDIHNELAYGFEISWYNANCSGKCVWGCVADDNNHATCIEYLLGTILNSYATSCNEGLLRSSMRRNLSAYDTVEEFLQSNNHLMPIRYSYSEIRKITGGFKEKLGEGGFGCVYKGKLRSGRFAAIKMLGKSKAGGQDFISEVATIGRIHHTNVVQLIGYCAEGSRRALVYDFMPNGSLNNHIFSPGGSVSLSWEKLYEISLGVARGIEYLHRGCDMQILHFDIKPHNILLDENFIPKVSDFGLAKLYPTKDSIASLTAARGTIGYMAPELFYKNIGRVSYKADVYSFGMLLLEIAGKRKSLNPSAANTSQIYFPLWVHDQVSRGKGAQIGDDATEYEHKLVEKMIIVGLWCIQMKPSDRPPMNKVVEMLEGELESMQLPPRPTLYPEERPLQLEGELSPTTSDDSGESGNIETCLCWLLSLSFPDSTLLPNFICASSCGHLHNISYPFRLANDPITCGEHNYNLQCEKNVPVLYLYSGRYIVQAINYNNFTIRLVDDGVKKDNCSSLPRSSLLHSNFGLGDPYAWYYYRKRNGNDIYLDDIYYCMYREQDSSCLPRLSQAMAFLTCPDPVDSPLYVDTAPCTNGLQVSNSSVPHTKTRSYINVGRMDVSDLMDSCRIDILTLLPARNDYKNMPFKEIHRQLAYGFEISWYNTYCPEYCTRGCFVDHKNRTSCVRYASGIYCDTIFNLDSTLPPISILIGKKKLLLKISFMNLGTESLFLFLNGYFNLISLTGLLHALKVCCGAPCVVAFLIYKWRRRNRSAFDTVEEFLQSNNHLMPIRYSYSEIRKITGGFREKLGEGGFGCVYKGKLRSGHFAAIKTLGKSKADGQDFISEVATIGRIHHTNVVQLIGYCAEGSKRALVYDFMPNRSLNNHIFSQGGSVSLSWEKLYEISLGVARGIEYLHRGCDIQILHFDIKPHNILLDENFIPKVSDFGLAKLYPTKDSIASLTAARGTIGYMAPELFYKNIGRVSYKADVYSFGMLLLEIAGKRKSLNPSAANTSQIYFPFWVHDQVSEGKGAQIGDDATEDEHKLVEKMILVGLWCIQMKPSDRPPMNKVVEMLEGDLESIQLPPRPTLYPEERPLQLEGDSKDTSPCAPSSCGSIHDIREPFRLETDPKDCGDDKYSLSCQNNQTAINYNNFTIRLVDAGVRKNSCFSLPHFPLANGNFTGGKPYAWFYYNWSSSMWPQLSDFMIFISCPTPLNSTLYVDAAACDDWVYSSANDSSVDHLQRHSYVSGTGGTLGEMDESCRLEMITFLPKGEYRNTSLEQIQRNLAYGFELSWFNFYCQKNCSGGCYLDTANHMKCISDSATAVCGTPCVASFLIYKWRRRHLSVYDTVEQFLESQINLTARYSYSDVRKMTGGFKEKLGEGGFGSVYKGKLRSGHFAAVKMLGKSNANGQDFINEVATIGRIRHANVVQLIGYCAAGSRRALVYDYMPNGSLNKYISSGQESVPLSWEKLYAISLGVARGIEYLHSGCDMQILHFDIKPHNILLDENFTPKISDFGLAKQYATNDPIASLTAARGTIGYMAPELFYKNIGHVSHKADVYSFGMLLLEITGKRKSLNPLAENSSQGYFPQWVYDQVSEGTAPVIVDASDEENKQVQKMIVVGLWCIQMNPSDRPPMNKVVEMLEGDLESLQLPPQPTLYPVDKPLPEVSMEKNEAQVPGFAFSWLNDNNTFQAGDTATIKIKVLGEFHCNGNASLDKAAFNPALTVNEKIGNSSLVSGVFLDVSGDTSTWRMVFTPIRFEAGAKASVVIAPRDAFGNNVSPTGEELNTYNFTVVALYENGSIASVPNTTQPRWDEFGNIVIEVFVAKAGNLLLQVEGGNQTLNGSPLPLKAKWKYETNAWQIFSKMEILVHQQDQYGNLVPGFYEFDANVVEKETNLSVPIADLGFGEVMPGIQSFSFSLLEPGNFLLTISDLKHDRSISNMPFAYTVFIGYCDGSSSIVNGSGLNNSIAGEVQQFSLYLNDIFQYPSFVGIENIRVQIVRENDSYNSVAHSNVPAEAFNVVYTPEKSGIYEICVFCGDVLLNGGHPFRKEVRAEGLQLEIVSLNKSGFSTGSFADNIDGTYRGPYLVKEVGTYEMCVSFDKRRLSPCPFAINDESIAFNVLENDYFAGKDASIVEFSKPERGSLLQQGHLFRYTPYRGYYGNDSFIYSISDANGNLATASVNISILNIPPQFTSFPNQLKATEDVISPRYGYADQMENISVTLSAKSGTVLLAPMLMQFWRPIWGEFSVECDNETKDLILEGNNDVDIPISVEPVNDPPFIDVPKFIILKSKEVETLIFDKDKDKFNFSVGDPDVLNFPGGESQFIVTFSVEVDDGFLTTSLPAELISTTELKLMNSYRWQPLQTYVSISKHFVVKANGIRFRGTLNDCNSVMQQLSYHNEEHGAVLTVKLNDMGHYGCYSDCAEKISRPLSAEATVNLIYGGPLSSLAAHTLGSVIIIEFLVVFTLGMVLLFFTCKCAFLLVDERSRSYGPRNGQKPKAPDFQENTLSTGLSGSTIHFTKCCSSPL